MTATPFLRAASASRLAFATTFWSFACCGAPESANAPPSMITSFCRSWMIRAADFGSIRSIRLLLVHVAEPVAADLHPHPVDGGRRRDVQRLPVVVAPVGVADGRRKLEYA